MTPYPELRQNPFRDPNAPQSRAQSTRLAGDRVSILFDELRAQLGKIEALQEELYFGGVEWGWVPRYRLDDRVLFTAHIFAGALEAKLSLEDPLRETFLASPRVATRIKDAIRRAPLVGGITVMRVHLSNLSAVRSFANLVKLKSRFLNLPEKSAPLGKPTLPPL